MIRSAISLFAAVALVACTNPTVIGFAIEPPTLDSIPDETDDPNLPISGTKTKRTKLWLQERGQPNAVLLFDANEETIWSTFLRLKEGENEFAVFSSDPDATRFSDKVVGKTTFLLGSPQIEAPTLNEVVASTALASQNIDGGKAAGTSVWISVRGADAVEAQAEGQETTWAYNLALVEGPNNFALHARSTAHPGLRSTEVGDIITLDTQVPSVPVITSPPESPTTSERVSIGGTKESGASVCVRINTAPNCVPYVIPSAGTTFNLPIPSPPGQLEPGHNQICLSSKDAAGNHSDEVCATVFRVAVPEIVIVKPQGNAPSSPVVVQVRVTTDGNEGSGIKTLEVCESSNCSSLCTPDYTVNGDLYTFNISGTYVVGTDYDYCVRAENEAGGVVTLPFSFVFGTVEVITDGMAEGGSLNAALLWDGTGRLHAVWDDGCINKGFVQCPESADGNNPQDIMLRRYDPTTSTWGAVTLVSDYGGEDDQSSQPAVAFDGTTIHLVWVETGALNDTGKTVPQDIAYRSIDPDSLVVGAAEIVHPGTATSHLSASPALAAEDNGDLHLVWARGSPNVDIFYSKRTGTSWGSIVKVDPGTALSAAPVIALDSTGVAHVVWQDKENTTDPSDWDILYTTVTGGTTVGTVHVVSNNAAEFLGDYKGVSLAPAIYLDTDDGLHIAWQDNLGSVCSEEDATIEDYDIFYRYYPSTFPVEDPTLYECLSDHNVPGEKADAGFEPDSEAVALVGWAGGASSDGVVAVWAQEDPDDSGPNGNADLVYRVKNAGSALFLAAEPLTDNSGKSTKPTVAVKDGILHFVWEDKTSVGTDAGDDIDVFYQNAELP